MPCADKTVIWENYKIGICQAGLDNKTGGTQLRLGAACFCTSEGQKKLVFRSVRRCSKVSISDIIYLCGFDRRIKAVAIHHIGFIN